MRKGLRLLAACFLHWKELLACGFDLSRIVLRRNQLLLFQSRKQTLVRCSLNQKGNREISSNHAFLTRHSSASFPQPLRCDEGKRRLVSGETMLVGRTPSVEEITENMKQQIIGLLHHSLYDQHKVAAAIDMQRELQMYDEAISLLPSDLRPAVREVRDLLATSARASKQMVLKTIIHGDLTYRNLVVSDRSIGICDFSRSGTGYAEFDVWLLTLDALAYRHQPTTFAQLMDKVLRFVNGDIQVKEAEYLYTINSSFAVNRNVESDLKQLFLYRTLILSLDYLQGRTGEMHEIVRQVRAGIPGAKP